MSGRLLSLLPALVLALVLGSCGVGGEDFTPGFEFASVGAAGGEVMAGDVYLEIPAGALMQDTAVAILPQRDPLTIQANDGCNYTFLDSIWCCGPIGLDLMVPGLVRLGYNESIVPAGFTEDDLVLLLWNDALQVLEPAPNAVHNTAANYFEVTAYGELGHLAIGVRDCTPINNNFIFSAVPQINAVVEPGEEQGDPLPTVFVANIDDAEDEADAVPSNDFPSWFIPSPDGSRLLFPALDFQTELTLIYSVALAGGAPVLVAGQNEPIIETDPLIGWLESIQNQIYLVEFLIRVGTAGGEQVQGQIVLPSVNQSLLSRIAGDGSESITTPIHGIATTDGGRLVDLRQSPNGQTLMMIWERGGFTEVPFERGMDVITTATGAVLSTGLVPVGNAQTSPRFTPDGQSILVVGAEKQEVRAWSLDASQDALRFDLAALDGQYDAIEDVVPLNDGTHLVVLVRREGEVSSDSLLLVQAGDPGTVLASYDLGASRSYEEIYLHPEGDVLYLESPRQGVGVVGVNPAAVANERFTPYPDLPVSSLSYVDINARNGALLLTTPSFSIGNDTIDLAARSTQSVEGPGVCITDRFGNNLRVLDVTANVDVRQSRWVFTVRRAPGMQDARIR